MTNSQKPNYTFALTVMVVLMFLLGFITTMNNSMIAFCNKALGGCRIVHCPYVAVHPPRTRFLQVFILLSAGNTRMNGETTQSLGMRARIIMR